MVSRPVLRRVSSARADEKSPRRVATGWGNKTIRNVCTMADPTGNVNHKSTPFAKIPRELAKLGLSGHQWAVLIYIASHINGQTGDWALSNNEIAAGTGIHRQNVIRVVDSLVTKELLIRAGLRHGKNVYRLGPQLVSPMTPASDTHETTEGAASLTSETRVVSPMRLGESHQRDQSSLTGETSILTDHTDKITDHKNLARSPRALQAGIDQDFESWYATYPRKRDKGHARTAYRSARKKTNAQTLLDGVKRYVEAKPPDIEYCYPATWLTGERWLDHDDDKEPERDWQAYHAQLYGGEAA
jgi:hypothetical protein